MKLREYRVREFRSVWDSEPIEVDDRKTCLVGKNEAGKTALLTALYRTNPIIPDHAKFNQIYDYPKREIEDYSSEVRNKERPPVVVVECIYELQCKESGAIESRFGGNVLKSNALHVSSTYEQRRPRMSLALDEDTARANLANRQELTQSQSDNLGAAKNWPDFLAVLEDEEQTGAIVNLIGLVQSLVDTGFEKFVCESILRPLMPKFLYFNEYYLMRGQENIDSLIERRDDNELLKSDYPLIGLINLARLDLDELRDAMNTEELKHKLENASNHLTRKVMKYWSQNKHIHIRFDVRDAKSGDPEGMRHGVNIWPEIFDTVHWASTPFGSRSHGFIWFFSFLAWYEDLKREKQNLILLLDEPGLSLHGRAQGDLLQYFDDELTMHQLIYTTHSPFMVDPRRIDQVRIVQDRGIDADGPLPKDEDGTKVFTDVLNATGDTLFPLQGALGYEIQQTLFVGPNCLLVEGPSDLLFLLCVSSQFEREQRIGLSNRWVITPVGGISKVSTFAALLISQKRMNVAALLDTSRETQNVMKNLYKEKLLKERNVRTYAEFLDQGSADIEDLFERGFYVNLFNSEFSRELGGKTIDPGRLSRNEPRTIRAIGRYLKSVQTSMSLESFNHFRPARYFSEHLEDLWGQVSEEVKDRFEEIFRTLNDLLEH